MNDIKEKKPDATLENTENTCISLDLTKEEIEMLDHYCQQTGISREQAFRDGIRYLNAKK